MLAFRISALILVSLAQASPDQEPRGSASRPGLSELMQAFRTSDVAEIYIVRRDVSSPLGLHPHNVRQLGCQYFIHRSTPQWAELERTMATASVRFEQAPAHGEMRVGLVFSDRAGTVLEIYSSDLSMPDGRVKGYIQRREMAISASFPQALRSFAEAHRDRVWVNPARPELCAAEGTP
jgi:hypothetical protein